MADAPYRTLQTVLAPLADRYFGLSVSGEEGLPAGPFILAANHASLLDWVFRCR